MELTMKVSKIKIDYKIVFTCGVCGVILLIVGLYLGFSFLPKFVDKKLLEAKVLKENTEQWKTFMKVPFSLNFKVYLFTIVNHEEVLKGAKPAVKETGPYVYKLNRWKDDVVWNYVSDEISYYDYELYDFDQEASGDLTEDDLITTLNIPYMTFLLNAESNEATAGFLPMIDEALESIFAENNGPFLINATVRDYLFDGIRFCKNGCIDDGFVAKMVCDKMKEKLNVTDQIRLDGNDIVYSTFYYRNNTRQAYITVNSGRKNNQEIGTMTRLNNNSFVKAWLNDKYQCNKVVGATSIFPINLSSKTKFQSFSPEICRSIKFEFGKMELVGLIKGYTYFASKSSFNNSKNVLENHCYCTNKTQNLDGNFGCLYDGVTDITTCQVYIMTLPLLDVSSTMIFMRVSTTVALTWCVVFAKVYERCDLVRELRNFDIPNDEIPTWVCIVQHESNYNTSAMNPASGDHGLFQISQIYWCSPPGDGYGCNSACSEFRDDDISDDLQCVRRIYNEHKRISGNGFNAWTVYPLYCKDDLSRYMSNCSEPDVPSQNSTENEISNEQDLDEYGYHFPALPSFPKEQKEESDDEQVFPQLPSNKYSINDSIQVKDEKVTDLLGSSQSLIKDEEQMLPYSKISIHHSVPVTVTRHVIFEKLPYSKQSIHHFTAVTNEKVQKDTKIEDIPSTNTDHVNTEITDERKEAEPVRFGTNSTVPFDVGRGLEPSEISSKTSQAALELENLNDNSKKLLGEISEASANLHEGSATGFKKQPIVSSTNLKISYNSKTLRPLEPTMLPSNIQRRMLNLTQFTETSYMKNATTNNRNFLTSTFSPPSTARDFTSTMNPNAKQLTFAPDSFFSWLFNSQTLPPIVPPVRPSRPPGERPGNSNRPTIFKPVGEGNPGRPRPTISRPVRPDIIPEQTNTTTRRPLRPNNLNRPFPHRRPFYRPSSVSELVGTTTTVRSVAMLNGGVTANNLGRNGGLEAEKGVEIKLNDNVVFLRTKYGYSLVRTSV